MSAHTPGPWSVNAPKRVLDCDTRGQLYVAAKDVTICCTLDGERQANARLIAAAPSLAARLAEVAKALQAACMVITDDVARKIALSMVRDARAALKAAGVE